MEDHFTKDYGTFEFREPDRSKLKWCYKCMEWTLFEEFSGNITKVGGLNNECKFCDKEYYQNNKEQRNKYRRKYYKNHKEEKKEYNKEYCKTHKEERKEYYKTHREERKEYDKEYRKTHKEEQKEYDKKRYQKNKLKKAGETMNEKKS